MSIRAATAQDIPAVLALWERARSPAARRADGQSSVERLMEQADDALLVAECEGRVVGALVAAWDGWRGNMYQLAVAPECRRRGVARRLVDEAHERLRARGANRITALVAKDEVEATGLWRALGYHRDEYLVRYFRDL